MMEGKIRLAISIVLFVGLLFSFSVWAQEPSTDFTRGKLRVSENKRFLVHEDGTPFFWLGDTAWELLHRLNRE